MEAGVLRSTLVSNTPKNHTRVSHQTGNREDGILCVHALWCAWLIESKTDYHRRRTGQIRIGSCSIWYPSRGAEPVLFSSVLQTKRAATRRIRQLADFQRKRNSKRLSLNKLPPRGVSARYPREAQKDPRGPSAVHLLDVDAFGGGTRLGLGRLRRRRGRRVDFALRTPAASLAEGLDELDELVFELLGKRRAGAEPRQGGQRWLRFAIFR